MPQENEPGEEMEQEAEIATPSNAQKSTAEGRNVEEFDVLVPEVQNNAVLLAATQYTYTLHYDANGGSGAPADQVVTSTALYVQIPVSSTIPVRDGYTFKGWANTRTGRVVYNYGNSATIAQGADNTKTIYAIWEAHVHSWGEWTSNGNGTHTRTCSTDSSHTETNDCSGGEPTCTEKAICENCHAPMATRSATILNGWLIQNSIGSNVCNAMHLRQRWIIPAVQPLAHRRQFAKSASQPMVTRWATILPAKHGKVMLIIIGKNVLDVMP